LTVGLAYALALQALIASVGLGMSAASTSAPFGLVICSLATKTAAAAPATGDEQNKHDQRPQCPFCFVAANGCAHPGLVGAVGVVPAYAAPAAGRPLDRPLDDRIVPKTFRRTVGAPRAPPAFSV